MKILSKLLENIGNQSISKDFSRWYTRYDLDTNFFHFAFKNLLLETSWAALEASWAVLEASCAVVEASCAVLEAFWVFGGLFVVQIGGRPNGPGPGPGPGSQGTLSILSYRYININFNGGPRGRTRGQIKSTSSLRQN